MVPKVSEDLGIDQGTNRRDPEIDEIAAIICAIMPTKNVKSVPPGWGDDLETLKIVKSPHNEFVNLADDRPKGCIGYLIMFEGPYIPYVQRKWYAKYYGI